LIAPVKIVGIGEGLPKLIVTNKMMEQIVDTSDEWIVQRTGIKQRYILTDDTTVSISVEASKKAIEKAGLSVRDIQLVIASTIASTDRVPTLAGSVQRELGISDCPAFDVSAGCTGFIYGLVTAASLMDTLQLDNALVLAGEGISKHIDWADRSTCVLFGDGAGAIVLRRSSEGSIHYPVLMGKSDEENVLTIKNKDDDTPWYRYPSEQNTKLVMKGREVFTFASEVLADTITLLKEKCKDKPFTKIIPHQANSRIIEYVARITGFKQDQFFINLSKFANTSSASILLALWDAYTQRWLAPGDRIALIGFGSGLTWGGVVIDWTLE
jgi:3-oxoacyl-[acyl-carrier-protein] synthase-3